MGWQRQISLCVLLLFLTIYPSLSTSAKGDDCEDSKDKIDIVILLDVTSSNQSIFNIQKKRLIRTIEHVEENLMEREAHISLIIFHHEAFVVSGLESNHNRNFQRITQFIRHLHSNSSTNSSVAKALTQASKQFQKFGQGTSRKLIILVHDGENKDHVSETVEPAHFLNSMKIQIFAISGKIDSNHYALIGYTGYRQNILISPNDINLFYLTIDEYLGFCNPNKQLIEASLAIQKSSRALASPTLQINDKSFDDSQECLHEKVDLVIVIDTSGSVFRVFQEQRQIALDLINSFPDSSFIENLQISIVRFAATSDVVKPFAIGTSRQQIVHIINSIKFTGEQTRIAEAVQLAIDQIDQFRRLDARQVFLLISDGHGQEFWNVVQATGQKLQATKAELFAVSATNDFKEDELLIYVGHPSRLFVGPKYTHFIPTFTKFIKNCIKVDKSEIERLSDKETSESSEDMVLEVETNTEKSDSAISVPSADLETDSSTPSLHLKLHEEVTVNPDQFTSNPLTSDDLLADFSTSIEIPTVDDTFTNEEVTEATGLESVVLNTEISQTTSATFISSLQPDIEIAEAALTNDSSTTPSSIASHKQITTIQTSLLEGSGLEDEDSEGSGDIDKNSLMNENSLRRDIQLPLAQKAICQIDLILIVDTSQSVNMDFQHEIEAGKLILEQFEEKEYSTGRIQVGIVSFARTAKIELPLASYNRSQTIHAMESIQHVGGTTSSVAGVHLALLSLISQRRSNARVFTILLTDGHSQDYWHELVQTAVRLQRIGNSNLIAFTASEDFSRLDLDTWTGNPSRVFISSQVENFYDYIRIVGNAHDCLVASENFNDKLNELQGITKKSLVSSTSTTLPAIPTTENVIASTVSADLRQTTLFEPESTTFSEVMEQAETQRPARADEELELIDSAQINTANALNIPIKEDSNNCDVDLTLVIDVSLSVETEFDQQLEFAVDLIKRLPESDVGDRIRVGLILFNTKSLVPIHLNDKLSKDDVLGQLLRIQNLGGSTSVVTGIKTAIEEIELSKRSNARQIVILISDGNSQDYWEDVEETSKQLLNTVNASYAVTVSKEYKIRELELYAGNKLHVYIEARGRQFINEMETILTTCPSIPETDEVDETIATASCIQPVDLVFLIDRTTDEANFYRLRQYAIDLVKSLPSYLFLRRLSSSIIVSGQKNELKLALSSVPSVSTKRDLLFELERLQHQALPKSSLILSQLLADATKEFHTHGRNESRGVVVFLSSGDWSDTDAKLEKPLHDLTQISDLLVISLADEKRVRSKLRPLVAVDEDLFTGSNLDRFASNLTRFIGECVTKLHAAKSVSQTEPLQELEAKHLINFAVAENFKCKYHKIDLQIILDASSSREEVFEHQRELALSLVERLPISAEGTHVAVGINSFTSVPVLRQNLGLGRDKKIVRDVLENINYHGGSTLTAEAVQLSIKDLQRGRRSDAKQVVVLMNDGISQDQWDDVVKAGKHLQETGAEVFGVALGEMIDLKELYQYVPNKDRIYRDGSTEKFLSDVVQLLKVDKDCEEDESQFSRSRHHLDDQGGCSVNPTLDLLFLFDNTDKSPDMKDPTVNSNRYLLLDILGSLVNETHVRVSVLSFGEQPTIVLPFTTISKRERIFSNIESIQSKTGNASYAEAVEIGLEMLDLQAMKDRKTALVIVGNGNSNDNMELRNLMINNITERANFTCLAVDSSSSTNIEVLSKFTTSRENVFDYDRNALFVEKIKILAAEAKALLPACHKEIIERRAFAAKFIAETNIDSTVNEGETVYSTIGPLRRGRQEKEIETGSVFDLAGEPVDIKVAIEKKKGEIKEIGESGSVKPDQTLTQKPHRPIILFRYSKKAKKSQQVTSAHLSPVLNTVPTPNPEELITNELIITTTPFPTTTTKTAQSLSSVAFTTGKPKTASKQLKSIEPTPPSFAAFFQARPTASQQELEPTTTFRPGCLFDVILVLDASGSVEETFRREKDLAAGIIDLFRVGPENARFSVIKFAASHKVKTIWSLNDPQNRSRILRKLETVPFTSGTTAIHSAILRAVSEYTVEKGARPGIAQPVVIMFTDGFGSKSIDDESRLLRKLVPNTYAVAINHHYPISRKELEKITGDSKRVYTDANIGELHDELKKLTAGCIIE